jgi:hypothetical protein
LGGVFIYAGLPTALMDGFRLTEALGLRNISDSGEVTLASTTFPYIEAKGSEGIGILADVGEGSS